NDLVRGDPVPGVAGLVLTGGTSSRMGRDKAALPVGGQTLAERVAGRLSGVVAPVLEVGPGRCGLPVAPEDRPGAGPLAALVAGPPAGAHRRAMAGAVGVEPGRRPRRVRRCGHPGRPGPAGA